MIGEDSNLGGKIKRTKYVKLREAVLYYRTE